jgi:hypothetical protein
VEALDEVFAEWERTIPEPDEAASAAVERLLRGATP